MNPSGTKFLAALMLFVFAFSSANAQVNVTDDISANTTWTAGNEYTLDGLIFVESGVTLTIEPGTVIKGLEQANISTGDGASALIVRRGAKIMAMGNADAPIIFTSELDDVNVPDDLDQRNRGLWGGVIILGNATTNQPTTDNQIEGIPETENALYGGTDDDDNSGTLKFVSIRHGGFSISGVEGDEINGLTLGGVGRGTTIENVEVYANFDDCFEWFGGTVNTKWLVGAFCGDDTYDYDQGFRGRGQFWFSIHDDDVAGRGGEHDGGDAGGDDATPFSTPIITNVTYIGSGADATVTGGDNNDRTFAIRDNAGGQYWYSVFTDYPGVAMDIEDLDDAAAEDSRKRLEDGSLAFADNAWWNYGAGSMLSDLVPDFAVTILGDAGNVLADPLLASISRTADGNLDPRPNPGSPVLVPGGAFQVTDPDGHFTFEATDYWGAFDGDNNWLEDWTALSDNGFLGDHVLVSNEDEDAVPGTFQLSQNFPNPFNPVTTIEFALDQSQEIRLSVYDVLGREVKVLEQGLKAAGVYSVQFDAQDLASGMYFYQLHGEATTVTKTMLLLK
ncbi:MAG: T9SS type A sorting domain-containing protein [Bacteroidota bacterium]